MCSRPHPDQLLLTENTLVLFHVRERVTSQRLLQGLCDTCGALEAQVAAVINVRMKQSLYEGLIAPVYIGLYFAGAVTEASDHDTPTSRLVIYSQLEQSCCGAVLTLLPASQEQERDVHWHVQHGD